MGTLYDIVIIGGGPSGITAGLYAARARMKTVLIEKALCGGQILVTDIIENFPGFPEGISGPDLADWMMKQARHFGLEIDTAEVKSIARSKNGFVVTLDSGKAVETLSVIIATGGRWNTLSVPGEKELTGRGVSYCATCDGPLFKGKDVVVIGGGDTALEDALFLTKFAGSVAIVHRRDRFRATKILQERVFENKKIRFYFNSVVKEITGSGRVESVRVENKNTKEEHTVKCDGVFVLIGMSPNSEAVKGFVELDEKGYVLTDDEMKTSAKGVFACGDIRKKLLRQVVTATGDGAVAAFSAQHYVESLKGTEYR